tara:strand:- start:27686 stop:32950 length:5265 start_codon:yes stop_codon:yes gene_type:complete
MPRYKNKKFNIPFYEKSSQSYRLKIKVNDRIFENDDRMKKKAADLYITHYFPEFYAFLSDTEEFEKFENAELDVAEALKEVLISKTTIINRYETQPPTQMRIVVFSLKYDIDTKRKQLEDSGTMPSFEENLLFFNSENEIGDTRSESTFSVATLGKTNNSLNDGLRMFNTQLQGFEGQISLNVDFNSMQTSTQQILNLLVTTLSAQLKTTASSASFSDADTVTIFFGKKGAKIAVTGMEYLLIEESIESQPMKIGYFSIIKYNRLLKDPLTLATLKNYQSILAGVQSTATNNTNYSFFDFLNDPGVSSELGAPPATILDFNPQPKKDMQNILVSIAADYGLIDVGDTEDLEKGFTTALSSEELQNLRQRVAENPEVYKKVYAHQKAKTLNTAVDVTKKIGDVLENGPLGLIDKNSALGKVFRQLGVDELAKEAFLCLTFGLSFEAGRLNKAVQNALIKTSSATFTGADGLRSATPYQPPTPPKPASISKPVIDPKMFNPFTISGSPPIWQQIQKTVVDSLQQAVLSVIEELAELLRENCELNNPRASDYGDTNIVELLNTDLESNNLPSAGTGTQLDSLGRKNGLSIDEMMVYLTSLSNILSSIEICILFQNRSEAPSSLVDRIIEFNLEYPNPRISEDLVSTSAIMGFFSDLAGVVDITDLCNEIANDLFRLNQDNVCLTEDDLGPEADRLLDLIENGLRVEPPPLNFECPDKEGFLNDPTITKSVPETFNTLAESVELQFIASAQSIKEILLEQTMTTGDPTGILKNAGEATGSLSSLDPAFLKPIITALQSLSSFDINACDVDPSVILGPEVMDAIGNSQTALDVVSETAQDPNFKLAIEGMIDKLQNISDGGTTPQPIYPSYRFNQQFLKEFQDYIIMASASYNDPTLTIPLYYEATALGAGAEVSSYQSQQMIYRFPDIFAPAIAEPSLAGIFGNMSVTKGGTSICQEDRVVGDVLYFLFTATQEDYDAYDTSAMLQPPDEVFRDIYPEISEWASIRFGATATAPLADLTQVALAAMRFYLDKWAAGQRHRSPRAGNWPSWANDEIISWTKLVNVISSAMIDYDNQRDSCTDPFIDRAESELIDLGYTAPSIEEGADRRFLMVQLFLDSVYGFDILSLRNGNFLTITYPSQTGDAPLESPNMLIDFQSSGAYIPEASITGSLLTDELLYTFENTTDTTQNPYTKIFVDSFEPTDGDPLSVETRMRIENRHFPYAYAILTDGLFDYIRKNGVFDAATLQALNFFHLNNNCPPSEVSDLLDVEGILAQMQKEFLESACNDKDIPLRKKIRNMIKYGMYLLLIQVSIAEFIIKNIFVFSAFRIDELIETEFIKIFMRQQIVASVLRYLKFEGSRESTLRMDLVEYFNIKIQREEVVGKGGIEFSDGSIAFPDGLQFSVVDDGGFVGFDEIIDYLITERLELGKVPVNNAIKNSLPGSDPQTLDGVFLHSMRSYRVLQDTKEALLVEIPGMNEFDEISDMVFLTIREDKFDASGELFTAAVHTLARKEAGVQEVNYGDYESLPQYENGEDQTLKYKGQGPKVTQDGDTLYYHVSRTNDDSEFLIIQEAQQALRAGDYYPYDAESSPPYPAAVAYDARPEIRINIDSTYQVGWVVEANSKGDVPSMPQPSRIIIYYKLWYYRDTGSSRALYLLRNFGSRIVIPSLAERLGQLAGATKPPREEQDPFGSLKDQAPTAAAGVDKAPPNRNVWDTDEPPPAERPGGVDPADMPEEDDEDTEHAVENPDAGSSEQGYN